MKEAIPSDTFPVMYKFMWLLQWVSGRCRVNRCFPNLSVFESTDYQTLPMEISMQKIWVEPQNQCFKKAPSHGTYNGADLRDTILRVYTTLGPQF